MQVLCLNRLVSPQHLVAMMVEAGFCPTNFRIKRFSGRIQNENKNSFWKVLTLLKNVIMAFQSPAIQPQVTPTPLRIPDCNWNLWLLVEGPWDLKAIPIELEPLHDWIMQGSWSMHWYIPKIIFNKNKNTPKSVLNNKKVVLQPAKAQFQNYCSSHISTCFVVFSPAHPSGLLGWHTR